MHGNPCLASSGAPLVRLVPAGLVSEPSEYRSESDLYLRRHEAHGASCGLTERRTCSYSTPVISLMFISQYV